MTLFKVVTPAQAGVWPSTDSGIRRHDKAGAKPRSLTILGSTGSVGKNTVALLENAKEKFRVAAITGNSNAGLLAAQAKQLSAEYAVIAEESAFPELKELLQGSGVKALAGQKAIEEVAGNGDLVISAIVGAAALKPTLAAIKNGAVIGLANKECLVTAGKIMMEMAGKAGASVIPVDSEHNALFQIFDFERTDEVEKITLTASGGPFLNRKRDELADITPEQAQKHPNWNMGAKISIDSATMMNKGLELIEAYHLFPVSEQQIEVLIHPESVIHGLVYYIDGAVTAGMSHPDMQVPISYALSWPNRMATKVKKLDLAGLGKLTFQAPDVNQFPALTLARNALKAGGTAPAILNAANEVAVECFLSGKIGFLKITEIVEETLNKIECHEPSTIEDILTADRKTRNLALELISHNPR